MNKKQVRFWVDEEAENYFDVYGYGCGCDCTSKRGALCAHDKETARLIESQGLFCLVKERRCGECGTWRAVDSLGMVFGDDVRAAKTEMLEADEDEVAL